MPARADDKTLPPGLDRLPSGKVRARYRCDGCDRHGGKPSFHSASFDKQREAERWLREQRVAVDKGTHVDKGSRETFRAFAEAWRKAPRGHREGTKALYERLLRLHVYPVLGDLALTAVDDAAVRRLLDGLTAKGLSPATKRQVHSVTRTIFRAAVKARKVPVTPFDGITLPRSPRAKVAVLTGEQVQALVDAAPDRFRALVLLAACTGMRQGELLGLRAHRVDFLRREVHVVEQMTYVPGSPPALGPLKTDREDGGGVRTIPLPAVALDALAAHMQAFPPGPSGLLFTRPGDLPVIRTSFIGGVWKPTVKRAGLPSTVVFHHLRHTYASVLIRAGESVKVVQTRLGHRTATMTLDTYTHLWEGDDERTRSVVEAAFSGSVSRAVSQPVARVSDLRG